MTGEILPIRTDNTSEENTALQTLFIHRVRSQAVNRQHVHDFFRFLSETTLLEDNDSTFPIEQSPIVEITSAANEEFAQQARRILAISILTNLANQNAQLLPEATSVEHTMQHFRSLNQQNRLVTPTQQYFEQVVQRNLSAGTLSSRDISIAVGEHMDLSVAKGITNCWPDNSLHELCLDDGVVITRSSMFGNLDLTRGFKPLKKNQGLTSFIRHLKDSSIHSLHELALLCRQDDPRLVGVEVFGGVSHLARMTEKLGFTSFQIADPSKKVAATLISKLIAIKVSSKNNEWNEFKQNYKPAVVAFISRKKLVELYGN